MASTGVSQSEISPCATSTLGRSSILVTRFIKIDPSTRPIEKDEPTVGHDDAERNPGETHPGPDIENQTRCVSESAGEQQRISDMTIVDPDRLIGADTTGFYRLGE